MRFFDYNAQGNYQMFSLEHLLVIFVMFVSLFFVNRKYRNKSRDSVNKIIRIWAIVIFIADPLHMIYESSYRGFFDIHASLPLYICSLFWILLPILAFSKENSIINRISLTWICTVSMFAGLLGFIFNIYLSKYSFYHFVPLRSLWFHYMMIYIPVVLRSSGYYQAEEKDMYLFYIPNILLLIPCYIVDNLYGCDYGYLNGGIGTPLVSISERMPIIIFVIIFYFTLYMLNIFVFYRPIAKENGVFIKKQKN